MSFKIWTCAGVPLYPKHEPLPLKLESLPMTFEQRSQIPRDEEPVFATRAIGQARVYIGF